MLMSGAHFPITRSARLFLLMTVLLALGGCSQDPIGKRIKVEGLVTVDGSPLPNGTISFRPIESKGNTQKHEPYATIGPDGKYKVMTAGKEGCAPGWYRVIIESSEPLAEGEMKASESRINTKYNDARTTDIEIEVVEKPAGGQYDIKLTR